MTTRDSLRLLLDELSDDDVDALARAARQQGLCLDQRCELVAASVLDGKQYPVLVALWDNDDDAIFDGM